MKEDVLACSVNEAFHNISSDTIRKVAEQWKLVLKLIVKGKGTNELVEKCHGLRAKLEDDLTLPDSDDENRVQEMIRMVENRMEAS